MLGYLSVDIICSDKRTVSLEKVIAAILVFQNNKTAAMLVNQTNPVGVELSLIETAPAVRTVVKTLLSYRNEDERIR